MLGRERGKLVNEGELTVRNKRLWEPLRGAATVKDVSDFSGGKTGTLRCVDMFCVCVHAGGYVSEEDFSSAWDKQGHQYFAGCGHRLHSVLCCGSCLV